jgi:hypothetical protein
MTEENPTELLTDREDSGVGPWGLEWEEMEQECIYHRYSEMENEEKWERLNQEIAKHESQILSLKKETKALGYDA